MYNNPLRTLESLNVSKYEILFTEALHDISNHIKNLYQEIHYHVSEIRKKMPGKYLTYLLMERIRKTDLIIEWICLL